MICILIGIVSGIVSGTGMGGGTILILFLSLFLNVEQHVAQATNLIFFIPTSITAITVSIKEKLIDFKTGIPLALIGIIGSIIGSKFAAFLNVFTLKKLFGLFLAFIAIYEIYSLIKQYIFNKKTNNKIK